jgi:hypothetical protein
MQFSHYYAVSYNKQYNHKGSVWHDRFRAYVIEDNNNTIGINSNHPSTRQRFSISHEIGHFIDYAPDMNIKRGNLANRLESLNSFRNNSKELQKNNILFGKESGELQGLLTHIAKAEKKLAE